MDPARDPPTAARSPARMSPATRCTRFGCPHDRRWVGDPEHGDLAADPRARPEPSDDLHLSSTAAGRPSPTRWPARPPACSCAHCSPRARMRSTTAGTTSIGRRPGSAEPLRTGRASPVIRSSTVATARSAASPGTGPAAAPARPIVATAATAAATSRPTTPAAVTARQRDAPASRSSPSPPAPRTARPPTHHHRAPRREHRHDKPGRPRPSGGRSQPQVRGTVSARRHRVRWTCTGSAPNAVHTRTNPARSASVAVPMPLTSSSSSTAVNAPCCLAPGDDPAGQDRSDPGQRVELGLGRGVEVERRAGRGGHRPGPTTTGVRCGRHTDRDLLAVDQHPGQVERAECRRPDCAPPAAASASTTREPTGSSNTPGADDQPRDVDHHDRGPRWSGRSVRSDST